MAVAVEMTWGEREIKRKEVRTHGKENEEGTVNSHTEKHTSRLAHTKREKYRPKKKPREDAQRVKPSFHGPCLDLAMKDTESRGVLRNHRCK